MQCSEKVRHIIGVFLGNDNPLVDTRVVQDEFSNCGINTISCEFDGHHEFIVLTNDRTKREEFRLPQF